MNAAASWGKEWRVLRGGPIASLLPAASWTHEPQPLAAQSPAVRGRIRIHDQLQRIVQQATRQAARMLSSRAGATHQLAQQQQAAATALFQERLEEFEALYARLANDASREVLLSLLRSRLAGAPPGTGQDHACAQRHRYQVAASLVERDTRKPWYPFLNRYCVPGAHGTLVLQCDEQALVQSLMCETYAYDGDGVTIRVQPGDVVIDGGSRHGEAAVYFADLAWPSGHVYAVELEAGAAALVGENLVLNPRVRDSVTVVERALSDRSCDTIQYQAWGAATSQLRVDQRSALPAQTPTTIDDLIDELGVEHVNFIKLDLGGWERRALAGAQRTLARFRPTLAVSVAHRLADLLDIPADLERLTSGYELFLDGAPPHNHHPMMFARSIRQLRSR